MEKFTSIKFEKNSTSTSFTVYHESINLGTQLSLYADDTKIWRPIVTNKDIHRLQKDIEHLHDWSLRNNEVSSR
jgi:hypothetical protein